MEAFESVLTVTGTGIVRFVNCPDCGGELTAPIVLGSKSRCKNPDCRAAWQFVLRK